MLIVRKVAKINSNYLSDGSALVPTVDGDTGREPGGCLVARTTSDQSAMAASLRGESFWITVFLPFSALLPFDTGGGSDRQLLRDGEDGLSAPQLALGALSLTVAQPPPIDVSLDR